MSAATTAALLVSIASAVVAGAAWREVRVAEKRRSLERIGVALVELVDARRTATDLRPQRARLLVMLAAFGHRDDLGRAWAVAEAPWNEISNPDDAAAAVEEVAEFLSRYRPLL